MDTSQRVLRPGFGLGGILSRSVPEALASMVTRTGLPPGVNGGQRDLTYMVEALRCAMGSVGLPNPNPAVGCLLVRGDRVIARGATEVFGGRHAERVAFETWDDAPVGNGPLTAYVTLEPCSHTGRQPPCVGLLADHPKVTRVVIASGDPNPLVNGEGLARLRDAGKVVEVGLLGPECIAWNFPFFASKVLGRPVLVAKWAQSLDGQLADDSSSSRWITGSAARAHTHWLRQKYDAILVGAGTLLHDAPRLDVRDSALPHHARPLRLVFDPRERLPALSPDDARRLEPTTFSTGNPLVALVPARGERKSQMTIDPMTIDARRLVEDGRLRFLELPDLRDPFCAEGAVAALMTFLRSGALDGLLGRPLQSVFCEGGPWLLSRLLDGGHVDAAHAFIAPFLLGSARHGLRPQQVKTAAAPGHLLSDVTRLRLLAQARLGEDTLLELVPEDVRERVFARAFADTSTST